MNTPTEVQNADVIFVNHSGGKDSQAMLAALVAAGFKHKIVIVHSDLGEMEWEEMKPFIEENSFGLPVHVVKPELGFFDLCRKYSRLPSGVARFCTSELKTRPISAFIKNYMNEHGFTKAINAMGIRSEESTSRAKKEPLKTSKISTKKHNIIEWFPIFDMKLGDVWFEIKKAGQQPHPIYSQGFSRLSCVFCVFGRVEEHKLASKKRPELFQKMVALELELGKTIRLKQKDGVRTNKYLTETCGE
jgi:3'-phosphoadenosine 5'-phosphosulfate sulfotransferase (PAPS reductase)/FAD synthetase